MAEAANRTSNYTPKDRPIGVAEWFLNPDDWESGAAPEASDWIASLTGVQAVGYGDGFEAAIIVERDGFFPDLWLRALDTGRVLKARLRSHQRDLTKHISLSEVPESVRLPKGYPARPGKGLPRRVAERLGPWIEEAHEFARARREARERGLS